MFYYKALVDAHVTLGLSPRLLMIHADVRYVMSKAAARETKELAEYLAGLLKQLALGGAEIASIPAFSPQVCAAELAAIAPLPLISLLDAILRAVEKQRLRRVAIFGARVTMETRLFGRLPDIEVIMPSGDEMDLIANTYVRVFQPAYPVLKHLGVIGLTVTLYLIGTGLSARTLREVGVRPFLQGVLLWLFVAVGSLKLILGGWIHL